MCNSELEVLVGVVHDSSSGILKGVSVVKQHNLVIKMLYFVSETTCFGQKWPSPGFYTD